jgi:ketosteroid isomerase-like protein
MDDQVKVREANARFYEAVSSQSLAEMEAVWSHASWVKCVHPGWELLTGWDKIRESWDNIFHNAGYLRITINNLSIQIQNEFAWVVCTEIIASAHEANYQTATAQATNIYHKVGEAWLLVHHHASPVIVNEPVEASQSIQ